MTNSMRNSQLLTHTEVEERWGIKTIELVMIMEDGELKPSPRDHEYIDSPFHVGWLQKDDWKKFFFRIEDIEAYEEKHPEYMSQDPLYKSKKWEILPYRDRNNKHFSKELSIAIETWLAIYETPGGLNSKQKHKKQIKAYLKKHYSSLSESAVERIATMINNDSAGAPKTF